MRYRLLIILILVTAPVVRGQQVADYEIVVYGGTAAAVTAALAASSSIPGRRRRAWRSTSSVTSSAILFFLRALLDPNSPQWLSAQSRFWFTYFLRTLPFTSARDLPCFSERNRSCTRDNA